MSLKLEISHITESYWTQTDRLSLNNVKEAKDLLPIALIIIGEMPEDLAQVCGPIGTGGLGSVERNLIAFNKEIRKLQTQGVNVFDQMPFENAIQKIKESNPGSYPIEVLTDFYLPLFKSGKIKKLYFMKDWKTSKGARYEHSLALELGIEIIYL